MYITLNKNAKVVKEEVNISDITDTDVLVLDDDGACFSITKQELELFAKDFNSEGEINVNIDNSNFNTLLSAWEQRGYEHDSSVYGVFVLRDNKLKYVSYKKQ